MHLGGSVRSGEEQDRARQRGESIRIELLKRLEAGPAISSDLLARLDTPPDVTLSEVVFQLGRLEEEGRVTAGGGGSYRLV